MTRNSASQRERLCRPQWRWFMMPTVCLMVVLGVWLIVTPTLSSAQSTPATSQAGASVVSPTPSPTLAPTPLPAPEGIAYKWPDAAWMQALVLLVAVVVIVLLLRFLRATFDLSLASARDLAKSGKLPQLMPVKPIADANTRSGALVGGSALAITGETPLQVGKPQEFKASLDPDDPANPLVASEVIWSFEAEGVLANSVVIAPNLGLAVKVTAYQAGSFTLRATHNPDPNAVRQPPVTGAAVKVDVLEPVAEGNTVSIPFFGQGYGSHVLAIVLLAFATILAMQARLSSEAIATLFGAVAGYIFGTVGGGNNKNGSG